MKRRSMAARLCVYALGIWLVSFGIVLCKKCGFGISPSTRLNNFWHCCGSAITAANMKASLIVSSLNFLFIGIPLMEESCTYSIKHSYMVMQQEILVFQATLNFIEHSYKREADNGFFITAYNHLKWLRDDHLFYERPGR